MARDVEERQEQIMRAALRVFSHKGFGKATMKDIAQEAEVTPGLIYYYFESKDALMKAIMEEIDPIIHAIRGITDQDFAQPVEDYLSTLFTQLLDLAEGEDFIAIIRIALSELLHNDNDYLLQLIPGILDRRLEMLAGYLERKMALGELRQAESMQCVDVLVGSLISFVIRRQVLHDPLAFRYTREQIAALVVDTVLRGLRPE